MFVCFSFVRRKSAPGLISFRTTLFFLGPLDFENFPILLAIKILILQGGGPFEDRGWKLQRQGVQNLTDFANNQIKYFIKNL